MADNIYKIIAAIDTIDSASDPAQLQVLHHAMQEFFAAPDAASHVHVCFRLFERFPEDDGYESFWSILHGIESLPNYEREVIASVQRRASQFPVLMINRMLNAGQQRAGDIDLTRLLESVAVNTNCPKSVRDDARRFIEHQRTRR